MKLRGPEITRGAAEHFRIKIHVPKFYLVTEMREWSGEQFQFPEANDQFKKEIETALNDPVNFINRIIRTPFKFKLFKKKMKH